VTDSQDRPVSNLKKDDFQLFEENAEQQIVSLSSDDAPASVGVVFDASGSMANKLTPSVAAVDQFFKTSLPGDQYLLVRFSDQPHFVTGFTDDITEISSWLHATRPSGWTALNDAVYMGIQKMKRGRNGRKALLILSDGGDNNSRYSAQEIRKLVREADVAVYAISFFQGSHLLESISAETGGRMIRLRNLQELPDAMEKLGREIRGQYILTYYSNNTQNDGKYRRLRVDVAAPMVHVSWRHGYYAPFD
jgi:Ca-activated chloride channel family protein